jgi:hypothetical protein
MAELLTKGLSQDGSEAELRELADRLCAQNPALRPIAEQMMKTRAQRRANTEGPIIEGSVVTEDAAMDPRAEQMTGEASSVAELRTQVEGMAEDLSRLEERNCDLAAALGACSVCWGGDTNCRLCRGRGHPGFTMPDHDLFLTYVVPAARMWRLTRVRRNGRNAPAFRDANTAIKSSVFGDERR